MFSDLEQQLHQYNSLIKENDELYRDVAKSLGLPDCAFWILYFIRENPTPMTQSEICSFLYQPKQTVNSSLKKLASEGYIQLSVSGHRSKQILLTEKGRELTSQTVDRVMNRELAALLALSEKERNDFLNLFEKYTAELKKQMRIFRHEKTDHTAI